MEQELNLSTGCYFKADDKGNYIDIILWLMRSRADIRNGVPYRPKPKPVYSHDRPMGSTPHTDTLISIGVRQRYSPAVLLVLYQLHRAGHHEKGITRMTGIPVDTFRNLITHKTPIQNKVWLLAHQLPLPALRDMVNRLRQLV